MTEQEVQWGEWEEGGGRIYRYELEAHSPSRVGRVQYITASYLNALEREVRDLRAKADLADEVYLRFAEYGMSSDSWEYGWFKRYDSLPSTSEGEGK